MASVGSNFLLGLPNGAEPSPPACVHLNQTHPVCVDVMN